MMVGCGSHGRIGFGTADLCERDHGGLGEIRILLFKGGEAAERRNGPFFPPVPQDPRGGQAPPGIGMRQSGNEFLAIIRGG